MVRERTHPLTPVEIEEAAKMVYRGLPPREPAEIADVFLTLDAMGLDMDSTEEQEKEILAKAQNYYNISLITAGFDAERMRRIASVVARDHAGSRPRRWEVLEKAEELGETIVPQHTIDEITDLVEKAEMRVFLPPERPITQAISVDELLRNCTPDQVQALAEAAVRCMTSLGAESVYDSDMFDTLERDLRGVREELELPSFDTTDPAVINWWQRLAGGGYNEDEPVWEPPAS